MDLQQHPVYVRARLLLERLKDSTYGGSVGLCAAASLCFLSGFLTWAFRRRRRKQAVRSTRASLPPASSGSESKAAAVQQTDVLAPTVPRDVMAEQRSDLQILLQELDVAREKIETQGNLLEEIAADKKSLSRQLHERVQSMEALQSDLARLKAERAEAVAAAARSRQLLETKMREASVLEQELGGVRQQLTVALQAQRSNAEAVARVKDLEQQLDSALVAQMRAQRSHDQQVAELQRLLTEQAAARQAAEREKAKVQDKSADALRKMQGLQTEVATVAGELDVLRRERASLSTALSREVAARSSLAAQLEAERARVRTLEQQYQRSQETLQTLQAHMRSTAK